MKFKILLLFSPKKSSQGTNFQNDASMQHSRMSIIEHWTLLTCCGGDPPPDPELLPPEYEDDPVGLELSGVMLGWIIVPRPRPPDTPNPRPCPSAPSSPANIKY